MAEKFNEQYDETGKVISTPATNAGQAKQEAKSTVNAADMGTVEATAKLVGIPFLEAKQTMTILNVGDKFSGDWRVKSVKHIINKSGYICTAEIIRGASADNDGTGGNAEAPTPEEKQSGGKEKVAVDLS